MEAFISIIFMCALLFTFFYVNSLVEFCKSVDQIDKISGIISIVLWVLFYIITTFFSHLINQQW